MDGWRRFTPIILKILGVDRFDHSASWPTKVRNVSRLGSQLLFWSPSLAVVVDAIANSWPPRIPNIPWYLRSSPFLRFEVVQAGVRSQPCRFGA
jgi:hypothetical protein